MLNRAVASLQGIWSIAAMMACTLPALSLSACATATAIPVPPGSHVQGFRIYDVKPLLVVAPGNVSVVIVPNYNRAYAVQFSSFMAKHDFTLAVQNGVYTNVHSDQDTTAVPLALINLLQSLVKPGPGGTSGGKALSGQADNLSGGRLQVFDIEFDDQGNLVGLRPLIHSQSELLRVPAAAMTPQVIPQGASLGAAGAASGGGSGSGDGATPLAGAKKKGG